MQCPQNVVVTLKRARGLNIGDMTSSDPFVLISTMAENCTPLTDGKNLKEARNEV